MTWNSNPISLRMFFLATDEDPRINCNGFVHHGSRTHLSGEPKEDASGPVRRTLNGWGLPAAAADEGVDIGVLPERRRV
jgi:hypothetical protein